MLGAADAERRHRVNSGSKLVGRMAPTRYGSFARTFIALNRAFGAGTLFSGTSLMGFALAAFVRGRSLRQVWPGGAFGLALILIGVVYLRARLSRKQT
jgi:hypothetical protein